MHSARPAQVGQLLGLGVLAHWQGQWAPSAPKQRKSEENVYNYNVSASEIGPLRVSREKNHLFFLLRIARDNSLEKCQNRALTGVFSPWVGGQCRGIPTYPELSRVIPYRGRGMSRDIPLQESYPCISQNNFSIPTLSCWILIFGLLKSNIEVTPSQVKCP